MVLLEMFSDPDGALIYFELFEIINGCMDVNACNHDIEATLDDGSCEYPESDDYKGYTIENPKPGFALKHGSGIVESYVDEIKNIIDIIKRKKQPEFTFEDEKILLELLYMAERSSKSATHLKF